MRAGSHASGLGLGYPRGARALVGHPARLVLQQHLWVWVWVWVRVLVWVWVWARGVTARARASWCANACERVRTCAMVSDWVQLSAEGSLLPPRGTGVRGDLLAQQPLVAPVSQGQKIGIMRVTLDGKPVGEYPVVALESVAVAGILGRAWDTLRLWIK